MSRGTFSRETPNGRGQPRNIPQGSQASVPNLYCNFCGKTGHTEDRCWKKGGKCLRCGSDEHQVATCFKAPERSGTRLMDRPTSSRASAVGNPPKVPARIYALDQQPVPDPSAIVEGTIPNLHRLAKILADSGTFHSFVSPTFLCEVDIKPAKFPYDLEVRTPTGDQHLITNLVYKKCEIRIGERKLSVPDSPVVG